VSVSPLRRVLRELRPWGLRLSEYSFSKLVAIDNQYSNRVIDTLEKFDQFTELLGRWALGASAKLQVTLLAKRDEISALRAYADRAFRAGKIELALMTARLMLCEAELIRVRYVADPVIRGKRKSNDALLIARAKSAAKRTKITLRRYNAAKKKARTRKELASMLGTKQKPVSLQAVRNFECANNITNSELSRLRTRPSSSSR
jgi:hypothetical protein